MAVHPPIPVHTPAERRRQEVTQVLDAVGDTFRVTYRIVIGGAGEVLVDVNFPVWFTDKPAVSMGGELDDGQVLVEGNFPWYLTTVAAWVTTDQGGATYYTGAQLACVCGGPDSQSGSAHFHAEGKALQQPLGA